MLVSFLDQLSAIDSFLQQARHYLTLHWCVTAHCLKNTATLLHCMYWAHRLFFFLMTHATGFHWVCLRATRRTHSLPPLSRLLCVSPSAMAGPKPVVLTGPSGAGKSTLLKKLMKEFDNVFGFSVSRKCAIGVCCWGVSAAKKGFTYLLHLLLSEDGLHVCLKLLKQVNPENTTLSYSDHFSRYW